MDYLNSEERKEFFRYTEIMMGNSRMHEDTEITPDNVFQPAHKANRDTLYEIISRLHLPGSAILGEQNLIELYELAKQGKSCIILSEHVSNLDVPSMFVRFRGSDNAMMKEIFEKFVFIAGVKLNENPVVKLYTEMFTRVVIFPIRSLSKMGVNEQYEKEVQLAKKINIKATRKIGELRSKGHIFIMYPAGTRYRPWDPGTKKGIKETTSYLNSFDYFCCSSINGNNMPPAEHEDMTKEPVLKDVLVFNFGKVMHTKDFISRVTEEKKFTSKDDKEKMKQFVVDRIMEDIDRLHDEAEDYRKTLS